MKTKVTKRYRIVEMTKAGHMVHAEIGWDRTMEWHTFDTEAEAEAWFCDHTDDMKFGHEYMIVAYFEKEWM